MNKKTSLKVLKINFIIFIVTFVLAVLYLGSRELFAFADLYYRTWVIIIGEVITFLILPLVAMALPVTGCIGLVATRRDEAENSGKKGGKIAITIVSIVMIMIAILYLLLGGLLYMLVREEAIEEESYITSDIIEGVSQGHVGWESYNVYEYYTPATIFLKKTYEPRWQIIEWKAQEEYGETFCVAESDKEREEQGNVSVYTLYMESDPNFTFHMFAGNGKYEFADDYPQALTNYLLSQNEAFCEIAEFPETIDTDEAAEPSNSFVEPPVVKITDEEQIEAVSEILGQVVDEVRKDAFFAESEPWVYLTLRASYADGTEEERKIRMSNDVSEEYIRNVLNDMYEEHEN